MAQLEEQLAKRTAEVNELRQKITVSIILKLSFVFIAVSSNYPWLRGLLLPRT